MKHKPFTTNPRERQFNIKNGLRVSRVIAVVAAWLLIALASCVMFMMIVYAWEYLVLGK